MIRGLLATLGVVGLAGCMGYRAPPETDVDPAEVAIVVESNNTSTIVVYLEARGNSRRLGEVHTKETKSWVFPYREFGTGYTRLRGEVIGSDERVFSPDIRVESGQIVRWTLMPRLVQSSITQFKFFTTETQRRKGFPRTTWTIHH